MKAIQTRWIPPTDTKPGRIRAQVEGQPALVVSWPGGLDVAEAHALAAEKLKASLTLRGVPGMQGRTVAGCLPDGSFAHVYTPEA